MGNMPLIFHMWIIIVAIDVSPGDEANRDGLYKGRGVHRRRVAYIFKVVIMSESKRLSIYLNSI